MKKILIILLWTITLIAGWCTKKIEKPIIFENYNITLTTKYNYKEINANIVPEVSTIKQYIQDTQTWFASSIIIAKTKIQEEINIVDLAEKNAESMTKKIPGIKKPSTDKFQIECKEKNIDWVIQKITIKDWKETQYINQIFFSEDNHLYWISTMTTNRTETKNLSKSIKNIVCLE